MGTVYTMYTLRPDEDAPRRNVDPAALALAKLGAVELSQHVLEAAQFIFGLAQCGFRDAPVVDGIHPRYPPYGHIRGHWLGEFFVFCDDTFSFVDFPVQKRLYFFFVHVNKPR